MLTIGAKALADMDPQKYGWDVVAELQAEAWKCLQRENPDYESNDVEETYFWKQARELADYLMK